MPLFYHIFYLLVPKIKICLKYFFGQKYPKVAIIHRKSAELAESTDVFTRQHTKAGSRIISFWTVFDLLLRNFVIKSYKITEVSFLNSSVWTFKIWWRLFTYHWCLLHFVSFSRMASLLSSEVDNEKLGVDNGIVGVDNEKALELDNRIICSYFSLILI